MSSRWKKTNNKIKNQGLLSQHWANPFQVNFPFLQPLKAMNLLKDKICLKKKKNSTKEKRVGFICAN